MAKKDRDLKESVSHSLEEIMKTDYDSIFVTDPEGIVMMANSTAERLLKTAASEMIGSNVNQLMGRGYYDRSTAMEAVEKKATVTGTIINRDGQSLLTTSSPIFDAEGKVIMVISTCRDEETLVKFAEKLDKERADARRFKEEVQYLRNLKFENHCLVAESQAMKNTLLKANTVAPTDSSVLLFGESGTGKEVLAEYLHRNSHRAKEAFISVNCGAIPESLIESELFGYEKGSFTGADAKGKPGLFEIADKGTIFLDEIGEMPLTVQVRLLRVLDSGDVRRLGGTTNRKIDVRLISATNRDLKKMVDDKSFREDLYYRINVIPLRLTPLQERPEDVLALSDLFLEKFNKKYGYNKVLSKITLDGFLKYKWPGNVRELRNLIERLVITNAGNSIEYYEEENVISLPRDIERVRNSEVNRETNNESYNISIPNKGSLKDVMGLIEKEYIIKVLQDCKGCVSKAANILEVDRSAVYRKVPILDIRDQLDKIK
ncbi:PAS domain-containing protein [Desulfosporosinus fructosivorans]|uniref:PAS domain-containing protein n=1 Tax=Desulfosporosinus fructosivorans TaxID=2018669 RepID=A0A4Z0R3Q6_9FIRM|nr:sigma 54-interacting transcriptional regulator [Desulfosporosinus fructosivorans]TGE37662.1 PAS domain-containing protein [Desulfosporosinus fructosivorans]